MERTAAEFTKQLWSVREGRRPSATKVRLPRRPRSPNPSKDATHHCRVQGHCQHRRMRMHWRAKPYAGWAGGEDVCDEYPYFEPCTEHCLAMLEPNVARCKLTIQICAYDQQAGHATQIMNRSAC